MSSNLSDETKADIARRKQEILDEEIRRQQQNSISVEEAEKSIRESMGLSPKVPPHEREKTPDELALESIARDRLPHPYARSEPEPEIELFGPGVTDAIREERVRKRMRLTHVK